MGSRINTNIGALNALKSLNDIGKRLETAQLRLATGKRINSAADDAAGYSIAKKFNARSQGLGQALANIGSAKNLVAVTEGHLSNIVDILTQMKTKATQAADDSLATEERNAISKELKELGNQIDFETKQATWNNRNLIAGYDTTGASSVAFTFQIGAGSSTTDDTITFDLLNTNNVSFGGTVGQNGYTAASLSVSVTSTRDVTSGASAQALMANIDTAIANVSKALSYVGSVVNRLTYQETSLTVARTNTESARSRIEDADMAYEQLEATKLQILQQTASAMLAQANAGPQTILSLFKG
jgi:flagellin